VTLEGVFETGTSQRRDNCTGQIRHDLESQTFVAEKVQRRISIQKVEGCAGYKSLLVSLLKELAAEATGNGSDRPSSSHKFFFKPAQNPYNLTTARYLSPASK
jgi:hypothetical protein